jgi:hypothetical protein
LSAFDVRENAGALLSLFQRTGSIGALDRIRRVGFDRRDKLPARLRFPPVFLS